MCICEYVLYWMCLQAINWVTGLDTSSLLNNNPFGSRVLRQATFPPVLPDEVFPNVSRLNQILVVRNALAFVHVRNQKYCNFNYYILKH